MTEMKTALKDLTESQKKLTEGFEAKMHQKI